MAAGQLVLTEDRLAARRWLQLALGVVCMTMIANLQYGWTLFVNPMQKAFGWDRFAIQVAFTIFIVAETWLVPLHGYLVDRYGPKRIVLLAGLLCGAAWVTNAYVTSLPMLYFAQAIGGLGAGAIYGAAVGNALKWFPDRRGFAAGVTAAGFGLGADRHSYLADHRQSGLSVGLSFVRHFAGRRHLPLRAVLEGAAVG